MKDITCPGSMFLVKSKACVVFKNDTGIKGFVTNCKSHVAHVAKKDFYRSFYI